MPISKVLGLQEHEFYEGPEVSHTFSQCERKGSKLALSGDNVFNSLVLPLVKAMEYHQSSHDPRGAMYYQAILTLGVAVLNAPMIGVQASDEGSSLEMLPWVRLLRNEAVDSPNWWEQHRFFYLDVVHADFFAEYVRKHVVPFGELFSRRVMKSTEIVADGKAFASGMDRDPWSNLHDRVKKRPATATLSRLSAILRVRRKSH